MSDVIKNDKICNAHFSKYSKQGRTSSEIFYIKKSNTIVKKVYKKYKLEIENNIKLYSLLNNKFNVFFFSKQKIYECSNFYFMLMKKYDDLGDKKFSFENFKNVMLQVCLLSIYLNFNLNLFHNDMHIGNFLIKNIDENIKIELDEISLNISKNLVKLIDHQWMSNKLQIAYGEVKGDRILSTIFTSELLPTIFIFSNYASIDKNNEVYFHYNRNGRKDFQKIYESGSKIMEINNKINHKNEYTRHKMMYKYIESNFDELFLGTFLK